MMLLKWEPFNYQFSDFEDPFWGLNNDSNPLLSKSPECEWTPSLDMYENKENLIVKVEVPGIDPTKVNISIEDGSLSLQGEKKVDNDGNNGGVKFNERSYGGFKRVISIPDSVDSKKVSAQYKDGLLTVTLPKREESQSKKINIVVK